MLTGAAIIAACPSHGFTEVVEHIFSQTIRRKTVVNHLLQFTHFNTATLRFMYRFID